MTDFDVAEGAPRVRFPSRERRGRLLGLSDAQLGVVMAAALLLVGSVWFGLQAFAVALVAAVVLVILGVARWHRESVLAVGWRTAVFALRSSRGETSYRRDVNAPDRRTALGRAGRPPAGGPAPEAPRAVASYTLPGALGDVQVVQVPGGAGFLLDSRSGLASATLEVSAPAWELRDSGAQEAAYTGFADLLSGLEHLPGLFEAVLRVRVDRASTAHLADYVQEQERAHSPAVSDAVRAEYWAAIRQASSASMAFSMAVTVSFDTRALAGLVKQSGGGLAGIAAVLADRKAAAAAALEHAGVRPGAWLGAGGLELALTQAADPVAVARQREAATTGQWRQIDVLPVMAVQEEWGAVRVDESWHATSWVAEWPRSEARTGFLAPLLYSGDCSRVVALQLRPVPTHKALAEVERAQSDMEAAASIRLKMRSSLTVEHLREAEALHEREEDLADGYGDVSFRGFVSVSAPDRDSLRAAQAQLVDAAHQARILLAPMWGQQAAALVTAAMPVSADPPTGDRR